MGIPVSLSATQLRQITEPLQAILSRVERIEERVAAIQRRIVIPAQPAVHLLGERITDMAKYIQIGLTLPAPTESGLTGWKVHLTRDAPPDQELTLPGDATEVGIDGGLEGVVDTKGVVSVAEVDDHGNQGDFSDPLEFTFSDVFPPSKPDQPTITMLGEVEHD